MDTKKPDSEHGEGNYAATRRHRKAVKRFTSTHDVEKVARDAEPESAAVADELARAEARGRARSKGEDPGS